MKQVKIMVWSKRKIKRNLLIIITSSISIYLLISLYFFSHFLFQTEINGINVSLKAHKDLSNIINNYIKKYDLLLVERDGKTELIKSHEIKMHFDNPASISQVNRMQNPFLWLKSLFQSNKYYIKGLYDYDPALLENKINHLKCFNSKIIEPRNADFEYVNGSYKIVEEIYGNKINRARFEKIIDKYIAEGRRSIDLNSMNCYENPKYTLNSEKTLRTKNQLSNYVSARITYLFGDEKEQLDGTTIHQWLSIDDNLEVAINDEKVAAYVKALSKKYDTVGIIRQFQSSTGKKVELQGGLYGWKIDRATEAKALIDHIKQGDVIEKEPSYLQKAFSREGNEIGNTYVEINITKQHLWFYKDGKLIIQGSVVTGNPNRGFATVLGVYMVNYKQKGATLRGPGYEAEVTYWMPFFGNMGLHDATWRSRFGGEIYLRNGTHGCVNAPPYLAKTIFEHIDEGTPVILYTE
jgi:lipoprotein-anchoring transpeptidase ErfK/SrfK